MRALITSAAGHRVSSSHVATPTGEESARLHVHLNRSRQTIDGVGGSLTQASAAALNGISRHLRMEVLHAMFSPERAAYSLIRTHVASCDFSTYSYSYAPADDPSLAGFSIQADDDNGHLSLITDAMAVAGADFRIIASPWTAPPWMKDNRRYYDPTESRGGRLEEAHHETFAHYMSRYVTAYQERGVPIWAVTPVNEPHGNQGTWESMEMSPEQQAEYVKVLARRLADDGHDVQILVFDQNRKGVVEYATPILSDPDAASVVYGTAVHWYDSTFRVYEDELEALHEAFPGHPILQTEGCIDNVFGKGKDRGPNAPLPWWKDDAWFWRKEATDWGWDYLDDTSEHPPYAPAFRYARDLVGGMAHWLTGWVDWNVVLDKRGGPNHVGNFCLAPILVDSESDTVYYTPLFSIMEQVSRTTRPGAVVKEAELDGPDGLWAVALVNPDGTRVVHLFNETDAAVACHVRFGTADDEEAAVRVDSAASSILTLIHRPTE